MLLLFHGLQRFKDDLNNRFLPLILCRHATLLLQILKKHKLSYPLAHEYKRFSPADQITITMTSFIWFFILYSINCHHLPFYCIVGWSIKMFWGVCWLAGILGNVDVDDGSQTGKFIKVNLKMCTPSTLLFDHELTLCSVGNSDSRSQVKDIWHSVW